MKRRGFFAAIGGALAALVLPKISSGSALGRRVTVPWRVETRSIELHEEWIAAAEATPSDPLGQRRYAEFPDGEIRIYSGKPPATVNDPPEGELLMTIPARPRL